MSDQVFDPDYFAQRELAMTAAIELNRAGLEVDLFDCPQLPPPPAELRVVRQAHARATALGLVLPPYPKTTVRFVSVHPEPAQGAQTRTRGGVIEMVFVAGQPLEGLRRLALHEFAHVHQRATDAQLSSEERETQAEMFAWNAMQGWRW
jgi:hypothetical protein